ncbi:MAG: chemotaxis protein CheB [Bacteroidia bacterium]|jgi:two-component system chemotaxis response regulator CheB|nr:chemotaxis protein CheB [Bacteroidia bacterium]
MEETKIDQLLLIGGSAGSLVVLLEVLPLVKIKATMAIVVIVHRKNTPDSLLSELLASRSGLIVKEIEDKEPLRGGEVYVAPPDYHILFETDRTISLDFSEKVNFSRPSIDVAFGSAASVYKDRLSCLLLSGANADGVRGLEEVKAMNGRIFVQDPDTAETSYMPQQALQRIPDISVLKPSEMAASINAL